MSNENEIHKVEDAINNLRDTVQTFMHVIIGCTYFLAGAISISIGFTISFPQSIILMTTGLVVAVTGSYQIMSSLKSHSSLIIMKSSRQRRDFS